MNDIIVILDYLYSMLDVYYTAAIMHISSHLLPCSALAYRQVRRLDFSG